MDDTPPGKRTRARSYTLTALLGVFVVAVILALASRLLPGGISRLAQRALRRDDGADSRTH